MESFSQNRGPIARFQPWCQSGGQGWFQRWRRGALLLLLLSCMLTYFPPSTTYGAANATYFPLLSLQLVAANFTMPVNLISAYDGTGRLFVVEKGGLIYIIENGVRLPTPFLDVSSLVNNECSECGLLGLAFPPDFDEKGYFFVNYTSKFDLVPPDTDDDNAANDTVIARFYISGDPNVADPHSKTNILVINQPASNHNGGHILFGPDGYLYIGMGDGGGSSDRFQNAQDPASLHGKILRIDAGPNGTYSVPPDNPFIHEDGYRDEIWAMGVRNPWRFGFDRITGDLYVADVGQSHFEEVNFIEADALGNGRMNFGWPVMEGNSCYPPNEPQTCDPDSYIKPVTGYSHDNGNCSISGGYVLRTQKPFQVATYLYGDFCTGQVWGAQRDGTVMVSKLLKDFPFGISTFGEDEGGNVYVVDYGGGAIFRLAPADNFLYMPGLES